MTRHQRRKLAIARQNDKLVSMATAEIARRNAAIVSANLANPIRPERSGGLGNRSVYSGGDSHRGYVCKAGGAMPRQRAMALAAKASTRLADKGPDIDRARALLVSAGVTL